VLFATFLQMFYFTCNHSLTPLCLSRLRPIITQHCCICCYVVGSARCRDTSQYFDEGTSCYVVYSHEFLTWYDARNKCLRNDGDLASFMTASFIMTVTSKVGLSKLVKSPHWVGLRSSWWTWLDGRQFLTAVVCSCVTK